MIKGKQKITKDLLLSKITEYDIFRFYCPTPFKLNKPFSSPFRIDKNPSFAICNSKTSDYLYYTDFTKKDKEGNCFDFVINIQKLKGKILNFSEVLNLIYNDFKLSEGNFVPDYNRETSRRTPSFFNVITREFTESELTYWNSYHITKEELLLNDIHSIDKLFINGQKVMNPYNELRFAYRYEHEGEELWKIYKPFDKVYKWFTNVKINTMEGLQNLVEGEKFIIVKSKKDLIIMKKFTPFCAATQNESSVAISQKNIEFLQKNPNNVYISFDSDEPGKKNSQFYTDNYGFKYLNTPDYLLPEIKDWSDWAKAKGLKVIEDFLKSKEIIK